MPALAGAGRRLPGPGAATASPGTLPEAFQQGAGREVAP